MKHFVKNIVNSIDNVIYTTIIVGYIFLYLS